MAFKSMRAGNWGVMVMDHDGNNQTQITTHPADDWNPVWSLVFAQYPVDKNSKLQIPNAKQYPMSKSQYSKHSC